MSDIKWEEGKTYRFKPALIEFFKSMGSCNERIGDILDGQHITVKSLNGGNVLEIEQYS